MRSNVEGFRPGAHLGIWKQRMALVVFLLSGVGCGSTEGEASSGQLLVGHVQPQTSEPNPPTFTGTAPASPSNQSTRPFIEGLSDTGTSVRLYTAPDCSGSVAGEGSLDIDGRFRIEVSVAPNSRTTFYGKASTLLASSACSTNSITYVHDDVAPGVPTLTQTEPASPSNVSTTPLLMGTAEPGAQVAIHTGADCGTTPVGSTTADASGNFSLQVQVSANSEQTFYARAMDAAGNLSGCSAGITYQHDDLPPKQPFISSTTPASPSPVQTPTVHGSAEALSTLRIFLSPGCSGPEVGRGTVDDTGHFSVPATVSANTLSFLYADSVDAVGNVSTCSNGLHYIHDDIPPMVPEFTRSSPASPSNFSTSVWLDGATDPHVSVELFRVADCSGTPESSTTSDSMGFFTFFVDVLPNTTTLFYAAALDSTGNRSACSTGFSYTHDDIPPATPTLSATDPASPSEDPAPAVLGSTEPGVTVSLFDQFCGFSLLGSGTAGADGLFRITAQVLANSTTLLVGEAVDAAGNRSSCSNALAYIHDTLPPEPPTLTGTTPFSPSPEQQPLVHGEAEPRSQVRIFIDSPCAAPEAASTTADDWGNFTVPVSVPADSSVTLFASATDALGHVSSCSSPGLVYSTQLACDPGLANCDGDSTNGCEVSTESDPQNCGACGNVCATPPNSVPLCNGSICGFTCLEGFSDCDGDPANGCEVATGSDPENCGACGNICATPPNSVPLCSNSACGFTCQEGFSDCDGDPANGCESTSTSCCQVDSSRELMITHLSVVEDPVRSTGLGAWTFGKLMTDMAGTVQPSTFVRSWLETWLTSQVANGLTVDPRTQMQQQIIEPWEQASGGSELDLSRAPFRLLAIVNRIDLRKLPSHAGEGRFVFGVVDASGNPLQFTVILEYRLPGTTQADVDQWASDWHALGSLPLGDPLFNERLQALTDRFAGPGADPSAPNGSALNQLRTNEISLDSPWQLREFRLDSTGLLKLMPVAQTPAFGFDGTQRLADFINQNEADILAQQHTVPEQFQGEPFLGASAETPFGFFWQAPGIANNDARHLFSLNTCSGCHAGETGTAFTHVFPRPAGQAAGLSGFLTGTSVSDPISGQLRTFDDLGRRATDLAQLVCTQQYSSLTSSSEAPAGSATPPSRVH